jgi:hypothetical protein
MTKSTPIPAALNTRSSAPLAGAGDGTIPPPGQGGRSRPLCFDGERSIVHERSGMPAPPFKPGGRHDHHRLHPLRDRPVRQVRIQQYARNWGQAIPRCGADLIGCYAPHEGSSTIAYGVYNIERLAAYEAYRARLAADPAGRENDEFACKERFIRREDRLFLRLASAPHAQVLR